MIIEVRVSTAQLKAIRRYQEIEGTAILADAATLIFALGLESVEEATNAE